MHPVGRKVLHRTLLAGVVCTVGLTSARSAARATGTAPGLPPSLEYVRTILNKYQDPMAAFAMATCRPVAAYNRSAVGGNQRPSR